jgi:hypothetical protein
MSQLTDIRAALAEEAATISGIGKAVGDVPPKIENAELPVLWIETGGASYSKIGDEIVQETRAAKILVAAQSKVTGLNQKEIESVETLYENCKVAFLQLKSIDVEWVQNLEVSGDTGIAILEGYSRDFIGFAFDVQISIVIGLTNKDIQ